MLHLTFVQKAAGARPSLAVNLERHFPTLAGVVGLATALWLGPYAQTTCDHHGWALSEVYGAAFNLAAILLGALITAYALLVSSTNSTIDAIRNTRAFNSYLGFVRVAIALAFIVVLLSAPVLVIKPKLISLRAHQTIVAAVWFGWVVAMAAASWRVARSAPALFEAHSSRRIPGG